MNTITTLALAAATAWLSGCATQNTREEPVRMSGDGADSAAAWAVLDPDNDGSLTVDELENLRAMALLQDFANADTDHDGRVSKTEWDAWWPRMTDHRIRELAEERPALDSAR